MRSANLAVVLAALWVMISPAASVAQDKSLCYRAYGVREAVVKKHGTRAPGRNVCRQGIRVRVIEAEHQKHHWSTREATSHEKGAYLRSLRRLNAPALPYMAMSAGLPKHPPAGTLSVSYQPVGLASCIVHAESGGNPRANNGSHFGIAQWSQEAWGRMGGRRFAWRADYATYQEQLQILSYGLSRWGCNDWCPYDPC